MLDSSLHNILFKVRSAIFHLDDMDRGMVYYKDQQLRIDKRDCCLDAWRLLLRHIQTRQSRNQSVSVAYALLCFCKIQLLDFAQALIAGVTSSVTRTPFAKINLARDRVVMPCNCGFLLYEKTTHVISFAVASTIFAQGETAVWPREITT